MSEARRPPSLEQARTWVGNEVDDARRRERRPGPGLFVDAGSGAPTWLIVKRGRFGTRPWSRSPLRECAAAAGRVWVAHAREAIRSAPVVDPARPLLREHELTICAHYGIGEGVGRAAEVAGRDEGAVTSQPA